MPYKTILVHVDASARAAARIDLAATLALQHDAHLIGAALTGVSRFIEQAVVIDPGDPAITPYLDRLRQRASNALDLFERQAQQIGVPLVERRLVDDEVAGGISVQARYCDLVVVGQGDPDDPDGLLRADFPEYVAMTSGAPVLVVPKAPAAMNPDFIDPSGSDRRILLAWNGSREARRTVQDAMPLLLRAQAVEVAIINPGQRPDLDGEVPGADIISYLSRHGVCATATTRNHVGHAEIGETLLELALQSSSDLLVMGCYGHSRFREMLLGGVTRRMLASMTLPVLMSH